MFRVGLLSEEMTGELHHIVRAAALLGGGPELAGYAVWFVPSLAVTGAAGAITVVIFDDAVEVLGNALVAGVAGQFVAANRANHLRDISVGVIAVEHVLVGCKGLEHLLVFEAIAQVAVLGVPRDGVEVEGRLIHSAMLGEQDALPLVIGDGFGVGVGPVSHLEGDVEGLLVAGVLIHIDHAGQNLMVGVEGSPDLLMGAEAVVEGGRVCAKVSILGLALSENGDEIVGLGGGGVVARARVDEGARREVVADVVAAQLTVGGLPAAKRIGVRRDADGDAEVMREPLVGQGIEIAPIELHHVLPKAGQETDLGHGERLRFPLDLGDGGAGERNVGSIYAA